MTVSNDKTFSTVFGDELAQLASNDPRICAITASMTAGTGLNDFEARFPDRFFDVGIAEGHAAAMAAGMAIRGAIPVFAVYSTFLQRSYDNIIHDVAISNLHVVFAVDRAGLVSGDGETHQGIFDVAYLCSIPGMMVFCPASFAELRDMLRYAVNNLDGPVAVRYPRGGEGEYKEGGADAVKYIREGNDFTLVTYGVNVNTAVDAAGILEREGISVEIIKLGRINPVDINAIVDSVAKTRRILVLEECAGRGSVGEGIAAALAQSSTMRGSVTEAPKRVRTAADATPIDKHDNPRFPKSVILLNTGNIFAPCGEINELRRLCGIDVRSVCQAVRDSVARDALKP
jgi:1-deoxy-D-xylulose-5-phosphate synthase